MAKLVSSPNQAVENVRNYRSFIAGSVDLVESLSKNRAWYAIRSGENWVYGSSKIIGYADITPEDYNPRNLDGRQTEAVLQKWFVEVEPNDPNHDELWEGLVDFLAEYGKSPSKLARINVLKAEANSPEDRRLDAICDLIVEVAKGLDAERITMIRKRLKTML